MRILYVGNAQGFQNADKFYLFPQRLTNGLTRNGHNVYIFNDRDVARYYGWFKSSTLGAARMNAELVKTCEAFAPELIILAHCAMVTNETLDRLRSRLKDVVIVHRNVDPLSDEGNVRRIRERVGHVDGIFVTSAGEILKQFSSERTFSAFIPNPVDAAIDTGRAFANPEADIDLFFAGANLGEGHNRTNLIQQILAGMKGQDFIAKVVGAGLNNDRLFGNEFMRTLARSKTGVIVNKSEDFYLYASDRMSQYLGNGLMVYAPSQPRYEDLFSRDEIVTYDNSEDCLEKVRYYHLHDSERRRIAENGHAKAHRIFDCALIARYMVDMAFGRMEGQSYPWPYEKYGGS